jgi:hypothetical protein
VSIAAYLLLTVAIVSASLFAMAGREGANFNILSIGPVYLIIVALYSIIPFMQLQILGLVVGTTVDNRLTLVQPDETDIARLSYLHLSYIVGFSAVYLCDGKSPKKLQWLPNPRFDRTALFVIYIALSIFVTTIRYSYVSQAKTYVDQYIAIDTIPLLLRQTYLQAAEALAVAKILLLYRFLVVERNRILAAAFLLFEAALLFDPTGSRRDLFVLLFAFVLLYNFSVSKISSAKAAILGFAGLVAFLLLGRFRTAGYGGLGLTSDLLNANSEFTSLFSTAVDLQHGLDAHETTGIGLWLYIGDFVGLIPQQLLPIAKISPSEWYVQTFYPGQTGQGFGFGAISESILGFGWIESFVRGGLIGLACSRLHRFFKGEIGATTVVVFYVWLETVIYNSFRITTFYPIHAFMFGFVPAIAAVTGLSVLFSRARARQSAISAA